MTRTKPHCACGEKDPARYYRGAGFATCRACTCKRKAALWRRGKVEPPSPRVAIPLSRNELIMEWIGAVL